MTSKKVLAVFGALGQQGSSVIAHGLSDPLLSQQYTLRAITRDPTSASATSLKTQNIEVVYGDVTVPTSLATALKSTHTVFAMTQPTFGPDSADLEYAAGKAIADAAVSQGAHYLIFSTLPAATEISKGKYTKVVHFDAKARVERYIRDLPIQSAFVSLGCYMQNFAAMPFLAPRRRNAADGGSEWVIARHNAPDATLPMVDAVSDTGKFVGAILAAPEKYAGQTFCASERLYTLPEVAEMMSKATEKRVVYEQVSVEEFTAPFPFAKDVFAEGFSFPEEFGYYGPESEGLVRWAGENARGRLVGFEEFLRGNPLVLS